MTAAQRLSVQQQLDQALTELAHVKKDLAELMALAAGPTVDGIFQPGHTYGLFHARYQCEHLTVHPTTGELTAWGWATDNVDIQPPWWVHRFMTTRHYDRWLNEGAIDLGPTYLAGEPHR